MKFGFSGALSLQSLSLPQAVEVLQCGSAPTSLSCMRMRRWEEGPLVPWGMLRDRYLDCCTERRVKLKAHPELLKLPSSPPGYCEETMAVGPLRGETHGAGRAQIPRHQTKHGRSPHTVTEQPQLQLHPKPLQSHLPVEEQI